MLAFVIGSIGGVLVGFWFARQPRTAAVFDPYVKMVNALPRVVLAPIFTLWLGLGIWSKVALGVTLVFFIVFFNVYQGVKEVSPTVLANARMLGMSERQLMRHVYWPSALSWMFSSLHTSVGFAVVGAVVGEYLGSAAGPRLSDPAGGRRVRRRRRVRRHVRARGLRDRDRYASSRWSRSACWSGGRWWATPGRNGRRPAAVLASLVSDCLICIIVVLAAVGIRPSGDCRAAVPRRAPMPMTLRSRSPLRVARLPPCHSLPSLR